MRYDHRLASCYGEVSQRSAIDILSGKKFLNWVVIYSFMGKKITYPYVASCMLQVLRSFPRFILNRCAANLSHEKKRDTINIDRSSSRFNYPLFTGKSPDSV